MTRARRQEQAWQMKIAGVPEDQIRDRLGYKSLASVRQVISRAALSHMKFRQRELEAMRDIELARLDALQTIAWLQAEDGNLAAIDRVLKIMQHRAALVGLEQAQAPAQSGTINTQVLIVGGGGQGEMTEQLKAAAMEISSVARRSTSPAELEPGEDGAVIDIDPDEA